MVLMRSLGTILPCALATISILPKQAHSRAIIAKLISNHIASRGLGETGLSGGQRQRVAIARALLSNPRILIFDEATSALDYESEHIIQKNMRAICQGRTVIIIAHRLSAVRQANRILVMDKGQIIESGNHQELMQHDGGMYRHLYNLQQG